MIIVDLRDVGVTDIPVKKMKSFVNIPSHSFKGQMFRLVSCNTSMLMRGVFNIVSLWLSEFEQQSMSLCAEDQCIDELVKYASLEMIEEKFGGLRPNIVNFFPPTY